MLSTLNLKKATTEEWTAKNPILKIGDAGVDTILNAIKIGDGKTKWLDLPWDSQFFNLNLQPSKTQQIQLYKGYTSLKLAGLSDVNINELDDNHLLKYDAETGKWLNTNYVNKIYSDEIITYDNINTPKLILNGVAHTNISEILPANFQDFTITKFIPDDQTTTTPFQEILTSKAQYVDCAIINNKLYLILYKSSNISFICYDINTQQKIIDKSISTDIYLSYPKHSVSAYFSDDSVYIVSANYEYITGGNYRPQFTWYKLNLQGQKIYSGYKRWTSYSSSKTCCISNIIYDKNTNCLYVAAYSSDRIFANKLDLSIDSSAGIGDVISPTTSGGNTSYHANLSKEVILNNNYLVCPIYAGSSSHYYLDYLIDLTKWVSGSSGYITRYGTTDAYYGGASYCDISSTLYAKIYLTASSLRIEFVSSIDDQLKYYDIPLPVKISSLQVFSAIKEDSPSNKLIIKIAGSTTSNTNNINYIINVDASPADNKIPEYQIFTSSYINNSKPYGYINSVISNFGFDGSIDIVTNNNNYYIRTVTNNKFKTNLVNDEVSYYSLPMLQHKLFAIDNNFSVDSNTLFYIKYDNNTNNIIICLANNSNVFCYLYKVQPDILLDGYYDSDNTFHTINYEKHSAGSLICTSALYTNSIFSSSFSDNNNSVDLNIYSNRVCFRAKDVSPLYAGDSTLGTSSTRWNTIYLVSSPNTSSDIRVKENIIDLESGLDVIDNLDVKSYTIKGQPENISYGVIAQDVAKKYPELVSIPHTEKDFYGIYTSNILFLAVKAIQELSDKIENLENRIKELTK